MKTTHILSLATLAACAPVQPAPVQPTDLAAAANVPEKAVLGFFQLYNVGDVELLPVDDGAHSGILFVNRTLADVDYSSEHVVQKWFRLSLHHGQSM
ncbi:AAR163Cp [Eremothecium gossypii ATCC 10895]|uniref:AAR163Cp n=1 Tax=Eremothecium gossypii (strain ATCC 10895 / CBS 109.51 / FGSC 9923 / NRRL Y-1056) TaxID=284811 RepID=Q75ED2_EREGS|nr:AAR163Cp [Eremothecium gossypii ATCC 10895]AAS50530.1 AAR163Cp [Eremothecium gossypii ATCC 10895]AEY94817.1 FAAR163Cp [Eremothecium gossypii FDAG1]